jgi:hypothetical protein
MALQLTALQQLSSPSRHSTKRAVIQQKSGHSTKRTVIQQSDAHQAVINRH